MALFLINNKVRRKRISMIKRGSYWRSVYMNKRYPRQFYIIFVLFALAAISFFIARSAIFLALFSIIASICAVLFLLVALPFLVGLLLKKKPNNLEENPPPL